MTTAPTPPTNAHATQSAGQSAGQSVEKGRPENWNPNTMGPDCDWCGECVWCDPYAAPVGVFEGTRWHMHSEPICAYPDCITYLTRDQMAEAHRTFPPGEATS